MENKPKYKLIIGVTACATVPNYKARILKIRETWYKRALEKNILVLFFLGEEPTDLVGPEFVYLPGVGNDYPSVCLKQNLGIKYAMDHYDFDFLHIPDSDSFLVVDNMMRLLENYDPTENVAIGGNGDYRTIAGKPMYFLNGGPGYVLTKACCQALYGYLENLAEDWRRFCIENGDDYFIPASDVSISYFLQHKTNTRIAKEDDKFFYGTYRECGCEFGKPVTIVSCHSMKSQDYDIFQWILRSQGMA